VWQGQHGNIAGMARLQHQLQPLVAAYAAALAAADQTLPPGLQLVAETPEAASATRCCSRRENRRRST